MASAGLTAYWLAAGCLLDLGSSVVEADDRAADDAHAADAADLAAEEAATAKADSDAAAAAAAVPVGTVPPQERKTGMQKEGYPAAWHLACDGRTGSEKAELTQTQLADADLSQHHQRHLPRCFVQQKTAEQLVAAGLQACSWFDLDRCAEQYVPVRGCDFEAAVLQPVQMHWCHSLGRLAH